MMDLQQPGKLLNSKVMDQTRCGILLQQLLYLAFVFLNFIA